MDATQLNLLQSQLRKLVTEGIGEAIAELKKHLPEFSAKYNPLILLESRLNDANLKNIQNILSDEALQLTYNQIRADLLLFISTLQVQDFVLPDSVSKGKSGALLYKIPKQMQLQQETKCLVRLAFDKPTIIKNIELTDDVVVRDVRVTEVMQVELIDPSAEQPFQIRSFSDEEQFVEAAAYTEWIFYVKPVREGNFPLMLKISVIELVQGKERVRNIVWEEQVHITAIESEAVETTFQSTGLVIAGATSDFDRFMTDTEERGTESTMPAAPPSPRIQDMLEPAPAVPAPKKKSTFRKIATPLAGVLLIATIGSVLIYQNMGSSFNTEQENVNDFNIDEMIKAETDTSFQDMIEVPAMKDIQTQPVPADTLMNPEELYRRLLQFKQDSLYLLDREDSIKLEKLIRRVGGQKRTKESQ